MSKKFIVIDSNSVLHRAYHALPYLSSNGISTNGVYGFMSMLLKVVREQQPDYMAACFDVSKRVFRHEFFEEYKAGRKKTDPELIQQFPIMKEFFTAMDVPVLEKEGYEADDIIGSVCKKFQQVDTYVLTGDKDSLQLVDANTFVLLMKKGISDVELYNEDVFRDRYGVEPSQFVDVKALMGDKSDNIPGVTKIGEKTALRLISQYGTLEGIYENIGEEKGKLKENLENEKDIAFLSRRLAQINCDMDIDNTLEDFAFKAQDLEKSYPLLEKYNMVSLINRANKQADAKDDKKGKISVSLPKVKAPDSVSINDDDGVKKAVAALEQVPLSILIGSESISFSDGKKSFEVGQQISLFDECVSKDKLISLIKPVMEKYGVITDDAKAFYGIMDEYDIEAEIVFDVCLAAYLLESSLKDYCAGAVIAKYMGEDAPVNAWSLYQLFNQFSESIKEFKKIYYDIELPLSKVLYDMEKVGFAIDADTLRELSKEYRGNMVELERQIFEVAGESFNINSTKQLSHILFDKLGLKSGKKTKTGYSTDADSLGKIREESPIVDMVLQYRKYAKLVGTYIDGFLPLIDRGGRVHTEFLQKGTVTGRISSKEPNLQNIPIRSESGREIRKAFIAQDGYTLVCADYSQIELRILAHISGDAVMIDAFKKGQDIHARTASEVFGVPIDGVDSNMRRSAKAVNFGIVYGLSPYGLSTNLGIPYRVAKEYIDNYFAKYSGVRQYMSDIVEQAKNDGYVDTLLGRRRYVPQIAVKNRNVAAFGERVALNTPIQGSAADMIKIAMIKVHRQLAGLDSRLILQVHDELIVEARDDEVQQVQDILKKCMENVMELKVPVVVDVYSGKRWIK